MFQEVILSSHVGAFSILNNLKIEYKTEKDILESPFISSHVKSK